MQKKKGEIIFMKKEKNVLKDNSGKSNVGLIIGLVCGIGGVLFLFIGVPIIAGIIYAIASNIEPTNALAQNTAIIDNIISQNNTSGLYDSMTAEEELLYNNLNNERKILCNEVNNYEKYKNNRDKVKGFYDKSLKSSEKFTISLREYALKYTKVIVDSNKETDEIYENLEKIYDEIYDEIATDFYDDVYKGVLNDMYEFYYEDVLTSDSKDITDYNMYLEDRTQQYKWYSETRSSVYTMYLKTKSDIYGFYSKIRRDVYAEDGEALEKDIKEFESEINKMKNINNGSKENNIITNSIDNTNINVIDSTITNLPSSGISNE